MAIIKKFNPSKLTKLIPHPLMKRISFCFNSIRSIFFEKPYSVVLPYTVVGVKRLRKLHDLVNETNNLGIEGDVVECGVYNGGSGATLAYASSKSILNRHTYLIDSFKGLPEPSIHDDSLARKNVGMCKGNKEKVLEVLEKTGIDKNKVTIVEGYFEDVLPLLPNFKIALLHIDADWYESVKFCLEQLYERVVSKGFVVLDDYGYWEGCSRALHDFLEQNKVNITIHNIDNMGIYFQKP